MWNFILGLVWALVMAKLSAGGGLSLNPAAVLVNDVTSVHHDQVSRHVTINLAETRRCREPTFMVRLSGMSLYLLDLVKDNRTQPDSVTFAYPPLHEVGAYFLEVLTLYCDTLYPNQFAHMCLVSPQDGKNVLTLPYSFEVKEVEHNLHPRPRWVLAHNATPALLPTRYQKKCGQGVYCEAQESDIAQHNLYHWTDKPPYEHLVKSTFAWGESALTNATRTGNETLSFCFVGASHSGMLWLHSVSLNIPHVAFAVYPSRYPQLFNVNDVQECTYVIIGYGQWPLSSWTGNTPYNAARYEAVMRDVFNMVKRANLKTQVFMRSMNLNPLGYRHADCPAGDYRHPPLVMMYNDVISKLCKEYNVPYIDMYHLQAPLWDIALDWNHPKGRVFTAEAEYVLHYVLTYSHKHHLVPKLDPNLGIRGMPIVNYQVRFTDSDTVYLFDSGKFRPFYSADSRVRMGYNIESDVVVVDASKKPLELIGTILPDI